MRKFYHTRFSFFWSALLLTLMSVVNAKAQNIDQIVSGENPLSVSGGVNLSQVFYGVSGIESRRDPYNYFLSGNINFDIYGFSVPLTFTYSNQQVSFRQPFNQFTFSPTYKNVTFRVGYSGMTFSKYTLNGHLFLGGGVEATSLGKWSVAAMYGRLQKAVELDTLENSNAPAYRRIGYGLKVDYKSSGTDKAEFILFRSRDNENSLNIDPSEEGILPEENLVMSIGLTKGIGKRIQVKAEWAGTAITRDIREADADPEGFNLLANTGPLFQPNVSSAFFKALNGSISYAGTFYSIGASYERVDPGYETHGAYFFNNDLESISLNTSLSLLNKKLNLAFSGGTQRNNIEDTEANTLERFVGSANVGYTPTPKMTFALSYSSFQSFTNVNERFFDPNLLSQFENLDTLDYRQVTQSANVNGNFIIGENKDKRQNVNVNFTFQDTADEQGGEELNSGSQFFNLNTAYSYGITPKNLNMTLAFNANVNESPMLSTSTLGPSFSLTKSLLDKKLRSTLSTAYNVSRANGSITNQVFNVRVGGNYTFKEKHNFNLNIVVLNRRSNAEASSASAFTEGTATLAYSYSFSR